MSFSRSEGLEDHGARANIKIIYPSTTFLTTLAFIIIDDVLYQEFVLGWILLFFITANILIYLLIGEVHEAVRAEQVRFLFLIFKLLFNRCQIKLALLLFIVCILLLKELSVRTGSMLPG